MRPRELTGPSSAGIRRVLGAVAATVAATTLLVASTSPASAHADFLGSDPPDGHVLSEPVEEIELRFSAEVSAESSTGRLLDGDGRPLEASVFQRSPDHLIVQPAEPLTDGVFVLLWDTASEDGHRVEGTVRFTVTGSEGSEAVEVATTTTVAPPATPETAEESRPTTSTPARVPAVPQQTAASEIATGDDVDMSPSTGERITGLAGSLGRWTTLVGALVAIGATAFAAFALSGTVAEIRRIVGWTRRAGILVIVGTLTEVLMVAATSGGWAVLGDPVGILDVLPTGMAEAAVLRIAGGIALLQSPSLVTVTAPRPDAIPAGSGAPGTSVATTERDSVESRRLLVREEWLTLAGLAAITVSYLVDGHSASVGPIARAANLVHVIAGGVWLGGIVVLADIVIRRLRTGAPTHMMELTARFSRVATVALVSVAIAGSLLAWGIVDEPSELVSGTWGRLLVGKVIVVAVAAVIGAFNHVRVVPRLSVDADRKPSETLARTLVVEAIALMLVVAITAALVVAAP